MPSSSDKNDVVLAINDVVDVRGVVTQIDNLTGTVYVQVGVTQRAVGTGTKNPFPDSGQILKVKLGDVLKV